MDQFGGECAQRYQERYLFYKGQSAILWGSNYRWQVIQREGFPTSCLEGGGRFYFADFVSTRLRTHLGVCAPAVCSAEEIMYTYIPGLYYNFFASDPELRFAVQLREYRDLTLLRFLDETTPNLLLALATLLVLAAMGALALLCGRRGFATSLPANGRVMGVNGVVAAATDVGSGKASSGAPLVALALAGIVLGDVASYTRWTSYGWHKAHSPIFASGRLVGRLAARALPAAQLLAIIGTDGSRRVLAQPLGRLAELLVMSLVWVALGLMVEPLLSVNLFGPDPWLRRGWTNSMVTCVNTESFADLFVGGIADPSRAASPPCPHLAASRAELRRLVAALPALVAAAPAAAVLGLAPGAAIASLLHVAAVAAGWAPPSVADIAGVGAAVLPRTSLEDLASVAGAFAATALLGRRAGVLRTACLWLLAVAAVSMAFRPPAPWAEELALGAAPPLVMLAAAPLLGAALGGCEAVEAMARNAAPAVPLIQYVLEGYVEPHEKYFSGFDYLARSAGLMGLALLSGGLLRLAWLGAVAAARLALRARLRIALEDAGGEVIFACRLPLAAMSAALLAALARAMWPTALPAVWSAASSSDWLSALLAISGAWEAAPA